MASALKIKATSQSLPVPQNEQEAVTQIAEIGRLAREVARIEVDLNDKVSSLTESASEKISPKHAQIAALTDGLKSYCEANRAQLTRSGQTKTIEFATGKVAWRVRPPKVSVRGKVEDMIERLKSMGLAQFLRAKEEINKDAMLDNPALARTVPGITVKSAGEDFTVEPAEVDIAEKVS